MGNGRAAAVMASMVRQRAAVGWSALLLAEGFAVDPDLTDPTGVVAAAFADLAAPLIAGGMRRYYLLHTALPGLSEALCNLGFGRRGAYGIQPAVPRRGSSPVAVPIAGAGDLEIIARQAGRVRDDGTATELGNYSCDGTGIVRFASCPGLR